MNNSNLKVNFFSGNYIGYYCVLARILKTLPSAIEHFIKRRFRFYYSL